MSLTCLVLGGTGWVGHHIALALHHAGHDVTIVSRGQKLNYAHNLPPAIKRVQADKNIAADIERVLSDGYDTVFDSVPTVESIENLARCKDRFAHYIHCSSTGGYAPLPYIPGNETLPYDHFMGGWANKGIVDNLALERFDAATIIRPTYITGPGLMPLDNLGARDPNFVHDILAGKPITLPNAGQALLQPVHVADLGESFRLAAEKRDVASGQIYNVTCPHAVTLTQYVQHTAEALGVTANLQYSPVEQMLTDFAGTVGERGLRFLATHMCFSIAKAQRDLDYQPRYNAQQAIAETAQWAAKQPTA